MLSPASFQRGDSLEVKEEQSIVFSLPTLPLELLQRIVLSDPTNEAFYKLRLASSELLNMLPLSTLRFSAMTTAAAKGHIFSLYLFCGLLRHLSSDKDTRLTLDAFFKQATPKGQGLLLRALTRQDSLGPFIPNLTADSIGHLRFYCRTARQASELLQLMPLCRNAVSIDLAFGFSLTPDPNEFADERYLQSLQLETCTNLRALSLYFHAPNKQFNDAIPQGIVQFFANQPLARLTLLEKLRLKINQALGDLPAPEQLTSLHHLRKLTLESFKGNYIPFIIPLTNLKALHLKPFCTFSDRLFDLTQLATLKIFTNEKDALICQNIGRFRSLQHFMVTHASLNNMAAFLKNSAPLQSFRLDSCNTTLSATNEEMLTALRRQTQLHTLQLCHAHYTTDFYRALLLHVPLRKLSIELNSDHSPASLIVALQETASACLIEDLAIITDKMNVEIIRAISLLPNLRRLVLGVYIPGNGLEHLSQLTRLTSLEISCDEKFSDQDLAKLENLHGLEKLTLLGNYIPITPHALQSFLKRHPRLKRFYCSSIYFKEAPRSLQDFPPGPNDLTKAERYFLTHFQNESAQLPFKNI